ncbi:unnamed protein product [Phytophthora lilii]|uniref:RxLR effector protein n=1 Tax=Phytophthora lilii TaxID=2077276 RepID=A0A9W6WVF3_9STRA|nr:unnamed protein product [Phytophthora lilii]
MRLGFIILMATATLAVSVAANSEQSKLAAVAAQNALQSVGDVPQKNARFLRTSTTEAEDEEEEESTTRSWSLKRGPLPWENGLKLPGSTTSWTRWRTSEMVKTF